MAEQGALTPVNFVMRSGDTLPIKVTVKDESGAVVDLTGATVKWGLFDDPKLGQQHIAKSGVQGGILDGIEFPNPTGGEVTVNLVPADTAALEGTMYHEMEITDSGGNVKTVMVGTAKVKLDRVA